MDSSIGSIGSIGKRLDNFSRCLSFFAIIAAYSSLRLTLKHTHNLSVGCCWHRELTQLHKDSPAHSNI